MWAVSNVRGIRPNIRAIIIIVLLAAFLALWQAQKAAQARPERATVNSSSTQTIVSAGNDTQPATNVTTTPAGNQEAPTMGKSSATVNINGQDVPVPDNGSVQKTIVSPDGKTTVNIDVQNSSTGETTNNSSSSTHVQVNTFSSSSSNSTSRTEQD